MKKYAILLVLVVISILAATGCSKQEVAWQTITYNWVDGDGNDCKATLKVSPWINTKNVDYIDAAWSEVGNDNKLPAADPESWGLKCKKTMSGSTVWTKRFDGYENEITQRGTCSFSGLKNIANAYYCVGEISIESLGNDPVWISPCQTLTKDRCVYTSTISKVYGNEQRVEPTWAKINPGRNTVSFVFVHFDDGENTSEMTNTKLCINGSDYFVWTRDVAELTTLKLSVIE